MITVDHLTKRYGDVAAVRDISFTAENGQVTGFLGPNGAGKTTTMRVLTGFTPPTSGRALVGGFDVFEQSMNVRRVVGYLPENVPLYRDLTPYEYLMYLGEIRGLRERKARAQAVLARVGLSARSNSRIRTLSKGMKQRVGLAAALLHDPQVLILDEPTIGLDPLQVLELRQLVAELGREHTVLFSTHILSEAEQVCDKIVIINGGQIIAQGTPQALRDQLARGGRVVVRVAGDLEAARAVLAALPAVQEAVLDRDSVVVTPADSSADLRPDAAQALMAQGFGLLEVRSLAVNLEDIFIELTRREVGAQKEEVA